MLDLKELQRKPISEGSKSNYLYYYLSTNKFPKETHICKDQTALESIFFPLSEAVEATEPIRTKI